MSLMFVILGVLTYYVAPSAFLFQQYRLFFGIINGLLVLMVLGLTFLAILLLPMVQNTLVRLFLFFLPNDRKLMILIQKSMESNKKRNTNTAIMFALCLSFLIFAGGAFELFAILIKEGLESQVGGDLYVVSMDFKYNTFIDEVPIADFLQE